MDGACCRSQSSSKYSFTPFHRYPLARSSTGAGLIPFILFSIALMSYPSFRMMNLNVPALRALWGHPQMHFKQRKHSLPKIGVLSNMLMLFAGHSFSHQPQPLQFSFTLIFCPKNFVPVFSISPILEKMRSMNFGLVLYKTPARRSSAIHSAFDGRISSSLIASLSSVLTNQFEGITNIFS